MGAEAAACEVWFYHLERTGLDQALPELLEKTLQRGWKGHRALGGARPHRPPGRLAVELPRRELPAARPRRGAGRRAPADLLTAGMDNPNAADALFLVDGAEPGDLTGYRRCIVVFDGADEAQVQNARGQFRDSKAKGLAVSYWKQQARGWEKQA
jgi:DNA polymerase-3 subunit chi